MRRRGLSLSKGGADLTFQCNKNELRELHEHLRSATRDLARALSPHSRGCWSSAHDPRQLIFVPLAACGKHPKCQLTGEAHKWPLFCVVAQFSLSVLSVWAPHRPMEFPALSQLAGSWSPCSCPSLLVPQKRPSLPLCLRARCGYSFSCFLSALATALADLRVRGAGGFWGAVMISDFSQSAALEGTAQSALWTRHLRKKFHPTWSMLFRLAD